MKRKMILFCSIFVFVFLLNGCSKQSPTVEEYYPIQENVKYIYDGFGIEYANYTVFIDYASDNKVQHRTNNGGTELVEVIEVADDKVTCVFRQPETYYRENFLNKESNIQEVLLMEPIKAGTTWTLSDGSVRTITGVSVDIETPSGKYSTVSVETENEYGKMIDYYAKNVGLVKRVNTGMDFEVSSVLSEVLENTPFVQTVRFYYPNINDSQLYFKDKKVRFETNDITAKVLEATYQEGFEGQPGDVLSANTKINSYELKPDGKVHLDLSKDFLTDMNAGSEYEAMILQCIANTFGSYYNQNEVILTIDNALYSSGHFSLQQGECLTVNLDETQEIK